MATTKLDRKGIQKYLSREPHINEVMNSLEGMRKFPKPIHKDVEEGIAFARKFTEEVVKPFYKKIDIEAHKDNNYLPWEFVAEANRRGLFTLWLPKLFGGKGLDLMSLYPALEEISSVCVGIANIIGVHYMGFTGLYMGFNIKMVNKIVTEVIQGEKTGKPCLISFVITEPDAGSDLEEPALLDKARVGTIATRVDGGYIINGRKIFISNGHISTWHITVCYQERKNKNATDKTILVAVRNGTKGFSFGTHENKMGQKACVASELVYEDCFVPDEFVLIDESQLKGIKKPMRRIVQDTIDFFCSATRAGVGAFATGVARGAYETALTYARNKRINGGELLINCQWAQIMLAEMYKNVNTARITYMESTYANSLHGLVLILYKLPIYYYLRYLPKSFFIMFVMPITNMKFVNWFFRKYYYDFYKIKDSEICSGWGSLAKFSCSDIGIINCNMALDIMGIDGCRHDIGAEKYFRDAKLLQIYEGTNQINRLNLLKNFVVRDMPEVKVFD